MKHWHPLPGDTLATHQARDREALKIAAETGSTFAAAWLRLLGPQPEQPAPHVPERGRQRQGRLF